MDCLSVSELEMRGKVDLWDKQWTDHQREIEKSTKTVQHATDAINHQVVELLDEGIKTVLPTGT